MVTTVDSNSYVKLINFLQEYAVLIDTCFARKLGFTKLKQMMIYLNKLTGDSDQLQNPRCILKLKNFYIELWDVNASVCGVV